MIDDEIIESFLNCKYKVYRKLNNECGVKTEYESLQEENLSVCKTEYYKRLSEKYGETNLLKGYNFGKNRRVPRTDVIIQPTLGTEAYQISFDAIEIIPDKKSNSKKMEIPILISSKEKISKIGKLSMAIKCVILSKTCGVEYEFGKIIYGSDLKAAKFKIEPFITEAKKTLNKLHKISKGEFQPLIFHKNHCKICEFQEACKKELGETDSLGRLRRMREKDIKKYNRKGIFTVNQLSYTFRPRKRNRRIKTKKHPYSSPLKALAIREQKVYLYDKINMPSAKTKVLIDMEGDSSGSFIYLIGILVIENGEIEKYSLWANDFDDEKQIFGECMKILNGLNDVHIFYFGKYESKVFKRMLKSNSTEKVKNLLMNKSTNILSVIYSNLYFPTYSNGLKEIGKYLGCTWSAPNASGIQSIVWRKKWKRSKDTKLKDTLIKYNYEDCVALKILTDFLYSIFNSTNDDSNKQLEKISYVKEIKSHHEQPNFSPLDYVSKDIEVITKCAYFEYQRNRIFFRTNKNMMGINKRKEKQTKIKWKANKLVEVIASNCLYCKSNNIRLSLGKDNFRSKVCLDLRISSGSIKKWITIYYTGIYFCQCCKRHFIPIEYSAQRCYGHSLIAWAIHQHIICRVSYGNLERTAKDLFGLPINLSQLYKFKFTAAKYYKSTYGKILRKIVNGWIIHIDETKVKLQKGEGYVWVLTNMEEVVYFYRPTRETEFLHDLLEDFDGILISDFYTGYDSLNCIQQKCLVHLIRDLNDALLKNPFDDELKELVTTFGSILRSIIGTIDRFGLKTRYLRKHKKEVKSFFNKLEKQEFVSDIGEKFQKRLIKYKIKLFTFLDHDGVPWNNNNAEHAIKHFAKYRRLVNGRFTENGLNDYLVLLSIYQTCDYKGMGFMDFLLSKEKDIDKFMRKH
jgi:predicted RecB family nuclease